MSKFAYRAALTLVSLFLAFSGAQADCTINPGFEGLNNSVSVMMPLVRKDATERRMQ
jgi:hypothetical protein